MSHKSGRKQKRPWQDVATEAQKYRDASISRSWPDMPQLPRDLPKNIFNILRESLRQQDITMTEMLPEALLTALASGELTATSVTSAFLRCASVAQKLVRFNISVNPSLSQLACRPTVSQNFYQNVP